MALMVVAMGVSILPSTFPLGSLFPSFNVAFEGYGLVKRILAQQRQTTSDYSEYLCTSLALLTSASPVQARSTRSGPQFPNDHLYQARSTRPSDHL